MNTISKIAIHRSLIPYCIDVKTLNKNIQIYNNLDEVGCKGQTFIFGSVQDCKYLTQQQIGICRWFKLSLTDIIPFVEDYYVNFDGYYKQCCQLNGYDCGKYCLCNNCNIQLENNYIENKWDIGCLKKQFQGDILFYISSPKLIRDEYTYWIVDEKIIGSAKCVGYNFNTITEREQEAQSLFRINYDQQTYENFINNIVKKWGPDDMYTITIGLFGDQIMITNYSCFSCSKFFYGNINQICNQTLEYLNS